MAFLPNTFNETERRMSHFIVFISNKFTLSECSQLSFGVQRDRTYVYLISDYYLFFDITRKTGMVELFIVLVVKKIAYLLLQCYNFHRMIYGYQIVNPSRAMQSYSYVWGSRCIGTTYFNMCIYIQTVPSWDHVHIHSNN